MLPAPGPDNSEILQPGPVLLHHPIKGRTIADREGQGVWSSHELALGMPQRLQPPRNG